MKVIKTTIALLTVLTVGLTQAKTVDPIQLLTDVDDLYKLDSSHALMTMDIVTPQWSRSMSMESWSLGEDLSLIRITAPKKDSGIATLKLGKEMWNYFPKIRKLIKVPPAMMMGSWMGSDFSNDDLMEDTSLVEAYEISMQEDDTYYLLTLIPKESTVTVWEKIEIWVDKSNRMPVKELFYDGKDTASRLMEFAEVTTFDGVTLPRKLVITPLNKEGQSTTVYYDSLEFNIDIEESFFSVKNLKRLR